MSVLGDKVGVVVKENNYVEIITPQKRFLEKDVSGSQKHSSSG